MRITAIETACVDLPLERPITTSIHTIASVSCLLVTLKTNEGIEGEGYAFCFGREKLRVVEATVSMLKPLVIGKDPFMTGALWTDMIQQMNFLGHSGITIIAWTPIDVACWDIVGKTTGQPLHRLFGGTRERVPLYASGGMWLSSNPAQLAVEAREFLAQGFKAMKIRLGNLPVNLNIERVESVRDAVGPDIALMVDVNQGLSVPQAIALGRALERFGLVWFEEPVPTWDHHGHAEIALALDMALASGETEYIRHGVQNMLERRSADILMPDLQRMGGYTEFRHVIGQMGGFNVPFSPHIFTEHSLHLALPGCMYIEHMPWFGRLFRETVEIDEEGMTAIPNRSGTGFTFDRDALDAYRF